MNIVIGSPPVRRRSPARWWIGGIFAVMTSIVLILLGVTFLPGWWAYVNYEPQEGDVIFQSLPFSRLVNAIEGATRSPYSHCGIVAKENDRWIVYEAFKPVGPTPLREFISRGRNQAFAVYRWRAEHQPLIPGILTNVRGYRGRPYDARYRLDDNATSIYCSELIYLAYRDASGGKDLGRLVTLGELHWQPYNDLIEQLEQAPPPLDREIITPRDLARAPELERVYSFGY